MVLDNFLINLLIEKYSNWKFSELKMLFLKKWKNLIGCNLKKKRIKLKKLIKIKAKFTLLNFI